MRDPIRPPLLARLPGWFWVSADVGAAVFLAAALLALMRARSVQEPGVIEYAAVLATALPIAVRRFWPRTVFVVVLIAGLGTREFLIPHADLLCLPLALYTLASRRSSVVALLTAMAAGVQGVVELPLTDTGRDQLGLVPAVLAAAWAAGTAVRQRRLYTERLAAHAAERARAEAAEERLRIARELHDVIGHSLSTIAVQAGVAGHVGGSADMSRALSVIEETSRSALRETRRLLGVLREDDAAGLAPAPGLADLDALAGRARAAGLEVDLTIGGEAEGELELTVYRIVQEALTNVLRHARARRARVRIEREEDVLVVEVTDDGAGRAGPPGHGLTGLRERVRLCGGEFEAGPGPSGGFRVAARLPR